MVARIHIHTHTHIYIRERRRRRRRRLLLCLLPATYSPPARAPAHLVDPDRKHPCGSEYTVFTSSPRSQEEGDRLIYPLPKYGFPITRLSPNFQPPHPHSPPFRTIPQHVVVVVVVKTFRISRRSSRVLAGLRQVAYWIDPTKFVTVRI